MCNKLYVSWNDVSNYIESLYKLYKDQNLTGVYGLPRGGLVLAVMISHKFNIPVLAHPFKHCIIVDDICDSGESLIHYVKNSSGNKQDNSNYIITTLFYNKNSIVTPNYYMFEKTDKWIVYPWEL